jgi:adenylate kinase
MRVVMLGAPGSGKGTQAKRLEAEYRLPQVSTGDLLRQAVADGTALGLEAKAAMDAGDLVSDDIVLGMIKERIALDDASNGFILDGYPRNRQQALDLAAVFSELGLMLDAAVLMVVPTEVLMKRLTGRRTCSLTGKLLNIYFSPREEIDACVRNGGELLQRKDDNEETIAKRLDVYERATAPLIEHYRDQGLLKTIAADGPVDEVYERLVNALDLSRGT